MHLHHDLTQSLVDWLLGHWNWIKTRFGWNNWSAKAASNTLWSPPGPFCLEEATKTKRCHLKKKNTIDRVCLVVVYSLSVWYLCAPVNPGGNDVAQWSRALKVLIGYSSKPLCQIETCTVITDGQGKGIPRAKIRGSEDEESVWRMSRVDKADTHDLQRWISTDIWTNLGDWDRAPKCILPSCSVASQFATEFHKTISK